MTYQRLRTIENRIQKIKSKFQEIGEMRPGSLSQQFHDPEKRKAYWQLSYTYKMRSRSEYVRTEFVNDTKKQVNAYRNFKQLVDEWIALALEHAQLKTKLALK
jgi:hypothetical protein